MKDYFTKQLDSPYESTKQLYTFISKYIPEGCRSSILDACCGAGAWSFYVAHQSGTKRVVGFDCCDDRVHFANDYAAKNAMTAVTSFRTDDIYNLSKGIKQMYFDGICLVQTLSWLPDWKAALTALSAIPHRWLALSSLFYSGKIEAIIDIRTYSDYFTTKESSSYNVLSIPLVEDHLKSLGYTSIIWHKFQIPIDLLPGNPDQMGSFTQRLADGTRLQFSGPISMPWYFLLARRD
jgi:SAM-dependent methyltransferase